MTFKKCWSFFFVTAFLFAVFAVGGCGGGKSNIAGNGSNEETIPHITNIFESEELALVMKELEEELSADNLTVPAIHFVTIISGEKAIIEDEIESS